MEPGARSAGGSRLFPQIIAGLGLDQLCGGCLTGCTFIGTQAETKLKLLPPTLFSGVTQGLRQLIDLWWWRCPVIGLKKLNKGNSLHYRRHTSLR